MSGIKFVLDTNIVIKYLNGDESVKIFFTDSSKVGISIITLLELLSFPNITKEEIAKINSLAEKILVLGINTDEMQLIDYVIVFRKKIASLKLPDAIILATAKYLNAELISYDKIFEKLTQDYMNI